MSTTTKTTKPAKTKQAIKVIAKKNGVSKISEEEIANLEKTLPYLKSQKKAASKITSSIELVTREIALEWLQLNKANREISNRAITNYGQMMKRHQWKLTHQGIAFDTDGNLQDGQNRLMAIADTGMPEYLFVFRNMPVENFGVLDSLTTRKIYDALYIRGIRENHKVISGIITFIITMANEKRGFAINKGGKNKTKVNVEDSLNFAAQNIQILNEAAEIANKTYEKRNHIVRSTLGGYYIIFSIVNEKKAQDFFRLYATGAELRDNHPILQLRDAFDKDLRAIKKLPVASKITLFVKAWNQFITNRTGSFVLKLTKNEPVPQVKNALGEPVEKLLLNLLPTQTM